MKWKVSKDIQSSEMLTEGAMKSQQRWGNYENADHIGGKKSAKININNHADSKILKNDL